MLYSGNRCGAAIHAYVLSGAGEKMSIEYRGFQIVVDTKADATDTQWLCHAEITGVEGQARDVVLPPVELALPKLKIDVLMGVSMVEHKARQTVDEWHIAHPTPV
jgi:hypothetical protein